MKKRLVLSFHGIGEPGNSGDLAERRHWCTTRDFVAILDAIPQVCAETKIPIEITFDDGYASDIEIAAPALARRGLAAAFFVCAGRIGKPGYLDAAQLRSLASAGMAIGSHGWDHVDWRRVRDAHALDREVVQARRCLEDTISARAVDSVAIPFGSYDRRVMKVVERAYTVVYTSDPGLAPMAATTVPRETYTSHRWGAHTLRALAAPRPVIGTIRQALAMAYKRHRGPPRAVRPTDTR